MRIGFTEKYKSINPWDAPQLKLSAQQLARICCFDPSEEIVVFWTHWIQIGVRGTASADKRSGHYKCFGRYEVLFGDGIRPGALTDPDECDGCKHQAKDGAVGMVTRRFATNVMQYLLAPNGSPRLPLAADCIAWKFNDSKYNRLVDINKEFGDPTHGLRVRDLSLKCDNETFQNMTISPLQQCLWQADEMFGKQFTANWAQNRLTEDNLQTLIGTTVDKPALAKLIAEAMGVGAQQYAGGSAPMNNPQDLQALLDGARPVGQTGIVAPPGFAPPPVGSGFGPTLMNPNQPPQQMQLPQTPPPQVYQQQPQQVTQPLQPQVPQPLQPQVQQQPYQQQPMQQIQPQAPPVFEGHLQPTPIQMPQAPPPTYQPVQQTPVPMPMPSTPPMVSFAGNPVPPAPQQAYQQPQTQQAPPPVQQYAPPPPPQQAAPMAPPPGFAPSPTQQGVAPTIVPPPDFDALLKM